MYTDELALSSQERSSIVSGRWFSSLSPALRHDMLRRLRVRRFEDREPISFRGEQPANWMVCTMGAVEISTTTVRGRSYTLTYVQAGIWFGETAIFGDCGRTHDVVACGETAVACMTQANLRQTIAEHSELAHALLALQARQIRWLFGALEEVQDLPLRSRLAAHILSLSRRHGDSHAGDGDVRVALRLSQSDLARLVGGSRQRLNMELKGLERLGAIRQEPATLIVTDDGELQRVARAC
jgi:CRP/FNR family transcriptional regulator, cyclic AMP receptor protein